MNDKNKLKKIFSTKSLPEATFLKSLLEENEISCQILNINNSVLYPEISSEECGIELWVFESDYEKARNLLSTGHRPRGKD